MSLDQLTANYTDSEGEDDDRTSIDDSSRRSTPMITRINELKDEGSRKETPLSTRSAESGTNTPVKKVSRLVSYANEDDDDEGDDPDRDEQEEEPDEELNSEPMDTGSDEGEEEKSRAKVIGVKLPPPPPGKCLSHLQEKVIRFMNEVQRGNKDYNAMYQSKKEFRNPGIYEKLIELLQLDELGSNYPL
ncbi:SAP30-binding protein, partial [Halocaridina rubra]